MVEETMLVLFKARSGLITKTRTQSHGRKPPKQQQHIAMRSKGVTSDVGLTEQTARSYTLNKGLMRGS
eukprot:944861-Amphidinium_carterae.1